MSGNNTLRENSKQGARVRESQRKTAEYIKDLAGELEKLSEKEGFDVLRNLFRLAKQEAHRTAATD